VYLEGLIAINFRLKSSRSGYLNYVNVAACFQKLSLMASELSVMDQGYQAVSSVIYDSYRLSKLPIVLSFHGRGSIPGCR
jgi:hypothetical protein